LISASERREDARLIDVLTSNFEQKQKRNVQSAFVIARVFMRQGHYADAKEWFRVAEGRNRLTPFYGNQIRQLIIECEQQLFAKGDDLFRAGEFLQARERYSTASHGLSDEENRRYSSFLRLACAYCRLGDYVDADEAVLQALKNNQDMDLSLTLSKLLQQILHHKRWRQGPQRTRLTEQIDQLANEIMEGLYLDGVKKVETAARPASDTGAAPATSRVAGQG
jgi:tetratricopeptide (TPR) repeat protein